MHGIETLPEIDQEMNIYNDIPVVPYSTLIHRSFRLGLGSLAFLYHNFRYIFIDMAGQHCGLYISKVSVAIPDSC